MISVPNPRVLVVEDDSFDLILLLRAVSRAFPAALVETAKDGADALACLQEKILRGGTLPDLVLTDIKMPRVSGTELLANLRSCKELRELRVAMVSSSGLPVDVDTATKLGICGFVQKSVDAGEMIEDVTQLVRECLEASPGTLANTVKLRPVDRRL